MEKKYHLKDQKFQINFLLAIIIVSEKLERERRMEKTHISGKFKCQKMEENET